MRNILLLIKYHFLVFLGNLTSKKDTKKYLSGGLVFLLVSITMIATFTLTAITTTTQFVELSKTLPGAEEMAMFSNLVIGLLLVILFTIMRSIYPSKYSDAEMLMALPITKTQIIIAKAFYNYLFDVASYAMVLLPSFIVYYILVSNATIMVVIWGVVFVLLAAILSSAISYIISLGFMHLATKFKNISLVQSLLTIICLGGYLVIQYSVPGYLSDFTGEPQEYLNGIWIMKVLISWILHNDIITFLIILLLCLVFYIIALTLRTYYFGKEFKTYQNRSKVLKYQNNKICYSLYIKELKYYFSNSVYFINTIIGCFFVIGISIAYRVIGSEQVLIFMSALPSGMQISPDILIVILSSMLLTTTVTSSVSISLEGNNLWILKAHPLKERDIFISKILVNVTISSVACLISALLFADYNRPLTLLVYFIVPLLCSVNTSIIGLLINLVFPKMEFDSVESVVKRSMSHPLAMFVSFIVSLVPAMCYFVWGKSTWNLEIFSLVSIVVNVIICFVLYSILLTKGVKIFKKL